MNRPLRTMKKRPARVQASGQRWSVETGRSRYAPGGVAILLIALFLVGTVVLGALAITRGPFIHTSAGDQPSSPSRSGSAAVAAAEVEHETAQPVHEVTPAGEVERVLSTSASTATPVPEIAAAPITSRPETTPTAEAEREPPLVQYLADPSGIDGGIWVEVSISKQTMVIFKGKTPIFRSKVSTGQPGFESPTGIFYVQRMLRHDDMNGEFLGEDYFYPDVPNVMYFTDRGHALHGVYWHDDFGTPLSHGCVGMPLEAAEYLFSMAYVGMGMEIFY